MPLPEQNKGNTLSAISYRHFNKLNITVKKLTHLTALCRDYPGEPVPEGNQSGFY